MTAPGFCMLLRKHLNGGKITDIRQPSLERTDVSIIFSQSVFENCFLTHVRHK